MAFSRTTPCAWLGETTNLSRVAPCGWVQESQTSSSNTQVSPGVGALTLTGYAPTVSRTENKAVAPNVGSLSITGYAPTVAQSSSGTSVAPGAGVLTLAGYAPTVSRTANQAVTPNAGVISITGYAPTVAQASSSKNVTPGAGVLTLVGHAPTVEQSGAVLGGGIHHPEKRRSKRVYLERDGRVLVFATPSRAAAWIAAERAQEVVRPTTRTKVSAKPLKPRTERLREPEQVVEIDALAKLIDQFRMPDDLTALIERNEYAAMVALYKQAMDRLEEEDIELLLLAA